MNESSEEVKYQLKKLWKEVFLDEDKYLDIFFEKVYHKDYAFKISNNGKIVAMLFMIPYDVIIHQKNYKALYLYALATQKDYRNRGYMSKLINEANEYADKNNYLFSFLIPANEELFGFYNKYGYNMEFKIRNLISDKKNKDYADYKNEIMKFDKAIVLNENLFGMWKYIYEMAIESGDESIKTLSKGLIRKGVGVKNTDLAGIVIGKVLI